MKLLGLLRDLVVCDDENGGRACGHSLGAGQHWVIAVSKVCPSDDCGFLKFSLFMPSLAWSASRRANSACVSQSMSDSDSFVRSAGGDFTGTGASCSKRVWCTTPRLNCHAPGCYGTVHGRGRYTVEDCWATCACTCITPARPIDGGRHRMVQPNSQAAKISWDLPKKGTPMLCGRL